MKLLSMLMLILSFSLVSCSSMKCCKKDGESCAKKTACCKEKNDCHKNKADCKDKGDCKDGKCDKKVEAAAPAVAAPAPVAAKKTKKP